MNKIKNVESVYTADAGGAFPGGFFGAGVNEVLDKYTNIVSSSGASAGAINTVFKAAGKSDEAYEAWLLAVTGYEKIAETNPFTRRFWENLAENHTIFNVQQPGYDGMEKNMPIEDFLKTEIHARIVYTMVKGPGITDGEHAYWTEQLLHPCIFIPYLLKRLKTKLAGIPVPGLGRIANIIDFKKQVFDNRKDTYSKEDVLSILKASCTMPPFYGNPFKYNSQLLIDGAFSDHLGGAEEIIREAREDTKSAVMVITRYPKTHRKNRERQKLIKGLCKRYDYPEERLRLISPDKKLPVESNYSKNLRELGMCYHIGKIQGSKAAALIT